MTQALSQFWIQKLGWTLLHFLWQGTAIAMVYAAARAVRFGGSLHWRAGPVCDGVRCARGDDCDADCDLLSDRRLRALARASRNSRGAFRRQRGSDYCRHSWRCGSRECSHSRFGFAADGG